MAERGESGRLGGGVRGADPKVALQQVIASGIKFDNIMKHQYKNEFSGPKFGEGESNKLSPNSERFSNDRLVESLISRLPNKSADIFNVKCKCSVILPFFLFFQTVNTEKSLKSNTHKIVATVSLKRQLSSKSRLFSLQ
jgi:hypothetical protein